MGTTVTTITLRGLAAAVCIVVDDVITDINAARGITAEGEAPVRAAFSAVRGPLVFATLAVLLGTVPFLFLGSVVTSFSRPLVLAFALAVLSSMVVSFLLTPTLGVLLLRGPNGRGANRPGPLVRGTRRVFDRAVAAVGRAHRAWALAGVLALALLAIIPPTGGDKYLPPGA